MRRSQQIRQCAFDKKEETDLKVKKKLQITAEEFFRVLRDSLEYDIETYGKKEHGSYKIEDGFVYGKKLKRGKKTFRTVVKVVKFTQPYYYQSIMKNDGGMYQLEYGIETISEDSIEVTYREDTLDTNGNVNTSILKSLFGRLQARNIKKRLSGMEKAILEKRKTVQEEQP